MEYFLSGGQIILGTVHTGSRLARGPGKPEGKTAFCALRVILRSESGTDAGSRPRELEKKPLLPHRIS